MGGIGSGLAPDTFQGDTLQAGTCDPLQIERAMAVIDRHARDANDRHLLVDAVFGTPRKARYHGSKPSPGWAEARTEWLRRCRDWVEETAGRVLTTAQIPEADQRAYVAATGDAWQSPAVPEAAPVKAKAQRATVPMVDADPVREHVRDLARRGMLQRDICNASGVSSATMGSLLHGRYEVGRPTQLTVHADIAEALLAVEFAEPVRRAARAAQCGPGMRYVVAGYRVGRCGECGALVATHIGRGGEERLLSHPSAGADATNSAVGEVAA